MANIPLKSIKFPDLDDTYTVPSNAGELPYNKSATYPDDTVGKALQDKPDADGTIANAEQLHSTVGVTDTEPFSFRTSGGSLNIGDREELTLVGVDVAWNQLMNNGTTPVKVESGVTFTKDGGKVTVNGTATGNSLYMINGQHTTPVIKGHKYLMRGCPSGGSTSTYFQRLSISDSYVASDIGNGAIYSATDNSMSTAVVVFVVSGTNVSSKEFYPQFIDLTQMLGSTIADYIYTLEQSTAGSGVAFFTKYFGTGYKAYDSGSLQSPVVKGIKMTGFNQWDEVTENGGINQQGQKFDSNTKIRPKNYIRALPSTVYYFNIPNNAIGNGIMFYDADKNFISYTWIGSASTVTTPSNASYMLFDISSGYGTTYNHDICINLHWDGERDGEYEAYKEYTYDIDPEPLHGMMTIEDGKLKADGDIRHADGTIDRWFTYRNYESGDESLANAITDGVHTSVKKQTPTTETAEPFVTPMVVDDWGTEEFRYNDGTTKFVPVGHSTKYLPNLKAKLEMSPDSPNGDGVYVVEQSGGINTYIPLASTDTITSIISRLEALENA